MRAVLTAAVVLLLSAPAYADDCPTTKVISASIRNRSTWAEIDVRARRSQLTVPHIASLTIRHTLEPEVDPIHNTECVFVATNRAQPGANDCRHIAENRVVNPDWSTRIPDEDVQDPNWFKGYSFWVNNEARGKLLHIRAVTRTIALSPRWLARITTDDGYACRETIEFPCVVPEKSPYSIECVYP
jgi:hypothetical protein